MPIFSLFKPGIYIQLSPSLLTVRNIRTSASISEVPEIAFVREPKPAILAVGKQARGAASTPGVQISNPFAHPRTLVSDFTLGEQVLKAFVAKVTEKSLLTLAPTIVVHPLEEPEGGFTQIEVRALHEMALSAGASQIVIWQGVKLSDQELLLGNFPTSGKRLS